MGTLSEKVEDLRSKILAEVQVRFHKFVVEVGDSSLGWLTTFAEVLPNTLEDIVPTIRIVVSPQVLSHPTGFPVRRITGLYVYWLPVLIRLSSELAVPFRLRLCASDDGDLGALSMDSEDFYTLIPTLYDLEEAKGFSGVKWENFFSFRTDWLQRQSKLFWRGSTTGGSPGQRLIRDREALLKNCRVALCLRFSGAKESMDIAISRLVQIESSFAEECSSLLADLDVLAEEVDEAFFRKFRYYPDIPGNALAWGTIKKHILGLLVFRAATKRQLYYYRYMRPWVHYIPVKPDFSDLPDMLKWADANPLDACMIAFRGYVVATRFLTCLHDEMTYCAINHCEIITPDMPSFGLD